MSADEPESGEKVVDEYATRAGGTDIRVEIVEREGGDSTEKVVKFYRYHLWNSEQEFHHGSGTIHSEWRQFAELEWDDANAVMAGLSEAWGLRVVGR